MVNTAVVEVKDIVEVVARDIKGEYYYSTVFIQMSEAQYSAEFIAFSAEEDNSIEEKEKNFDEYSKEKGETLYSTNEEVTLPPCK